MPSPSALEREGEIVAGVVYNPITDEMFTAEKGKGAYLNDAAAARGRAQDLSDALVATGIPHLRPPGARGVRARDAKKS